MFNIKDLENTDIPFRDKLSLPEDFTFGVEIEFSDLNLCEFENKIFKGRKYKGWSTDEDASVVTNNNGKNYGGEFISPVLFNEKESYQIIKDACEKLCNMKATTNHKTSAQVHIGAHLLKDDIQSMYNLMLLWITFENVIYKFSVHQTEKLRQCHKLYAAPYTSDNEELFRIIKDEHPIELLKYIYEYKGAYDMGLNFLKSSLSDNISETMEYHYAEMITALREMVSYGTPINSDEEFEQINNLRNPKELSLKNNFYRKNNTIEFRTLNGTLDPFIWQNAVNLFGHLMTYATSSDFDENLIAYRKHKLEYNFSQNYNYEDANLLANLIFEEEIDKLAFLKQCEGIPLNKEYINQRK